ncbi:hypothetical protein ACWEOZ_44180, partial [Actinoplanes sp. NPDC004185]
MAHDRHALIGESGGYFFGNASEAGFYLPSNGAVFALNFTRKNLHVNGKDVWHAGISFVNDDTPDTGFYHIADGVFAVTNNGRETLRFLAGSPSNR